MKNNKIISFLLFITSIIFVFGLILFFIKKDKVQNVSQNDNEIMNNINEYEEKINKLSQNETNNKKEEVVITISETDVTSKENTINITNKDVEFIENLNTTDEDAKKIAIENKIYAREAIKMGISLSQDEVEEIESLSSSNKFSNYIQDDDTAREKFKERVYTYLMENRYKKALKNKILDEVSANSISIENETINDKMNEYIKLQENFDEIENPTEEDRKKYLNQTYSLYYEIEDLYLKLIKEKYLVDFK